MLPLVLHTMKYGLLLILLLPLGCIGQTHWDVSIANGMSTYQYGEGVSNTYIPTYSLGIGINASASALNGAAGSLGIFFLHDRVKSVTTSTNSYGISLSTVNWLAFPIRFGKEFQEGRFQLTTGIQPELKLNPRNAWMNDGSKFNLAVLVEGQVALTNRLFFQLNYSQGIINLISERLLPDPRLPHDIKQLYTILSGRLMGKIAWRISPPREIIKNN